MKRRLFVALGALLLCASADAATLDLVSGVMTYTAANTVANALTVSLAGSTYTIDDPSEAAITLTPAASAAGCVNVDANTVTCPRSAISSWSFSLGDQNDIANLSQVLEPTTIRGGTGNDTLTGGANADTFVWNPGDASDSIDGGPGADTFSFNGANINEVLTVTAIANGFHFTRDVATVALDVVNVEALFVSALGADDTVSTVPLPNTTQTIDGGTQTTTDTLNYNAGGVCTSQGATTLQTLGAQPVTFSGFEAVNVQNQCTVFPSTLDLSSGVLAYTAGTGDANAVSVSFSLGTYTIADSGTPAIQLGATATAAGCANSNPSTVTCPRSAITSWVVSLGDQNDTANLSAVIEPTTIRGGQGNDTLTGGANSDTFLWNPGDASDLIDGGPGNDTFSFSGANINENLAVTAIPNGFHFTRDIATVAIDVLNVEALSVTALAGDDTFSTRPLPKTSQTVDGGTQSSADTLSYDAGGVCTSAISGFVESAGSQPVIYSNFEGVTILNQCAPSPVRALPDALRACLVALLGLAVLIAAARAAARA